MDGSSPMGLYYTQGQLMQSTIGSAYIDFNRSEGITIGEVYHVNFGCLLRINHLESTSGEFPRGYDLDLLPIWVFKKGEPIEFIEDKKTYAFFYRRRNEAMPIKSGDWTDKYNPIEEIGKYLSSISDQTVFPDDLIKYMNNNILH
jgi:gamma-glutamylcyclotransferase (GGCT)/AIG2-like uncharacterized protein YtfP